MNETSKQINWDHITCLIVDDDKFSRTFIKTALYQIGIKNTKEAATAQEAIEVLRNYKIHVALFDQQMPEQTGLELVLSGIDSAMGIFRKYTADEKKSALEQLEKFNCTHLADRNFSEMSSGEQIRVLIARALVSKPDLLILDEPSVFLDPAGREKLLSELDLLPQKYPDITMLFITQRTEDILPCFKHGILLSQGRIYDSGASEKLLTAEKLSTIFQIKMQLVAGANNRIWSICS